MNPARATLWRGGTRLLLMVAIGLLAGCGGRATPTPPVSTPAVPVTPTAAPTAGAMSAAPVSSDTPALSLVWWTPEWFAPAGDGESQQLLQEFVRDFAAAYPDITVEAVPRPAYGKGGILDFLSATARVAPSALPDIVSIDLSEVRAAVGFHLLQPMTTLLPDAELADFFPFAIQAGLVEGAWYAIPFAADLDHLLYDTARVPIPPRTWDEAVQAQTLWLFALSNREGSAGDALLLQYLSAGGALVAADGQNAHLTRDALLPTLQFYEALRTGGVFSPDTANLSPTDILALYLVGDAPMVQASATDYLRHRNELAGSGYTYLPTMDGQQTVIANGWGLAITTDDPVRQRAAMRFIRWLVEPSRNGRWSRLAGWLPTRPSALGQWSADDAYVRFLSEALAAAQFVPSGPRYADARRQLRQAVGDVLTAGASAQDVVNRILGEASR